MKVKKTKSTTYYFCYAYSMFYDWDDKSYSCDYDISEEINKVLKHKHKHRRASYYIRDGQKIYYKDFYDYIYKLYHNIDIIINGSELNIFVDI